MSDLHIKQRSYIAVTSKLLSSQEIEDELGLKADKHEHWGKGRLRLDPSYQITNVWKLVAEDQTSVGNQLEMLIKHLKPAEKRLVNLVTTHGVEVHLQIVRYFDDPDGQEEIIDSNEAFIKLPGQHQLLGWWISPENLAFLVSVKADLDVDEYN